MTSEGKKVRHYYPEMSCGIAAGFLVAAIHNAGLVTVTTTPMNCGGKLRELLGRPSYERVELVLPVGTCLQCYFKLIFNWRILGYAAVGAEVPRITKKPLNEVLHFV
jgi:hypothetical protein